jgi:HD-like signal output (HDOD) protein
MSNEPNRAAVKPDPYDLLARLSAADYKPPLLPAIAMQLHNLVRKPSVKIAEIATLLERDPILSAATLRYAHSPLLQGISPIRTITEAITRIGLRRASEFFFRAVFESEVFRCRGGEEIMERLRRHSVATAELSRQLDQATVAHSESAYLCGLLHDVGITACILALGIEQRQAAAANLDLFWPSIARVQGQFAVRVARMWDLPSEVQSVIYHHVSFGATPSPHPLSAVTYLAEYFATQVGYVFADENSGEHVDKAMAILGMTTEQRIDFEKKVKEICSAVL